MNTQEFGSLSSLSFSFATFLALEEWSNVVTKDDEGHYDKGELFGKKLVAAITYLVLPVIALVEGVVRGIFALFATLLAPCLTGKCGEWFREKILTPLASGAIISFSTPFLSLQGFGFNFQKPSDITSEHWMTELPEKKEGEEKQLSCWERLYFAYWRGIRCFIDCLDQRGYFTTSMALGTVIAEPSSALRAGVERLFYGCSDTPHFSGINPSALTSEQLKHSPVLFIHGNYHHPSGCTALAKVLKEEQIPVFTVSLHHGRVTEEDERRVAQRVQEIQALYRAQGIDNVKIDLIGHSRGGYVADAFAKANWDWKKQALSTEDAFIRWKEEIGKVILLGYHRENIEAFPKHYEIHGKFEAVLSREACEDALAKAAKNPHLRKIVPDGHLGILYHPHTHEQIVRWLRP